MRFWCQLGFMLAPKNHQNRTVEASWGVLGASLGVLDVSLGVLGWSWGGLWGGAEPRTARERLNKKQLRSVGVQPQRLLKHTATCLNSLA